ncbi:MAG: hypothetical protein Q8898_07430 [Bacillota bacterium]|nr:hypothetical protein [Bacillota bacterium]
MRLYEKIITILEEKGPLPLPSICEELNNMPFSNPSNQTLSAEINSIIMKKNEIFHINNGAICLQPNKVPLILNAYIETFEGCAYQVWVNFQRKNFVYFVLERRTHNRLVVPVKGEFIGDIALFKQQLYSVKVWDWEPSYRSQQGIILDGTNWSVSLRTTSANYKSEGMKKFPPKWKLFCRSIENLTGSPFR